MASVGIDVICVFCLQPGASVSDPRKLPCGHVGCFSCIENVNKATKEFECPNCSFKCEKIDAHELETAAYSPSASDGSEQLMCGICFDKSAVVFCVKCQKLLCTKHDKDDDERAITGGYALHHHVKAEAYVLNKHIYIRHFCKRHSDKKTVQACSSCLDTFCLSCDATVKCSTTNDLHEMNSLQGVATLLRTRVNELRVSLDDRRQRCQSLLKSTYKQLEALEKIANEMLEDVDRIMNEQIEQIKLEAEKVKDEITHYKEEFCKKAEENTKQVLKCYERAAEGLSDLNTAAMMKSTGHMIENFSMIEGRIKATLSIDITPVFFARKHLKQTGLYRSVEVQLRNVELSAIEYKKTEKNSDYYTSVRWISADRLVTASNNGVELRDRELNIIRSIRIPDVYDVIRYKDELLVLQYMNNGTKSVQLYSMQLVKIRDIVSFSTNSNYYTQIAVIEEKIVASDSKNKCLHVWALNEKEITRIDLKGMESPRGVSGTSDGCVLISDWAQKGSVRKYKLGGDYQLLWESDVLEHPWGISESESGDFYVSKCEYKKNALYQLSCDGKLLKTITCEQLSDSGNVYGISVMEGCLAAACNKEGINLFQLIFST